MLVSFVLRLSGVALTAGTLAGQVEEVDTGTTAVFRDAEELVRVLVASVAPGGERVPAPPG